MRTVRSQPGMTQGDALLSLQRHARASNEEIISFDRKGPRWVAELQKVAEFPPADEKEPKDPSAEEAPAEKKPSPFGDDENGEDAPGPEGDDASPIPGSKNQGPEGEKGEEKGELRELLSLIHQIADAMGIAPEGHGDKLGDEGPMPPGPMGPGGSGGPPPGPELGAAPEAPKLPSKLGPGDVLPHQTPVGAPAFAATRTANPLMDPSGGAGGVPAVSPPCSKCGGQTVGGVCPNCTSAAGGAAAQQGIIGSVVDPAGVVGQKRTITAKVDQRMTEVDAWRQATAAFKPHGYAVKQLVPQADGTWIAVLEG